MNGVRLLINLLKRLDVRLSLSRSLSVSVSQCVLVRSFFISLLSFAVFSRSLHIFHLVTQRSSLSLSLSLLSPLFLSFHVSVSPLVH